jgi:dUTP pyrophosphatase
MRIFEVIQQYQSEPIELPRRQTTMSAGYDLASIEEVIIQPGDIVFIKTGLKVKLGQNEVLLVYPRSSLGIKKQLMMSNGVGVIDADYYNNEANEGHIMIPLYHFGTKEVVIQKGERVAQGIFQTFLKTEDDVPLKQARQGGFGSSS